MPSLRSQDYYAASAYNRGLLIQRDPYSFLLTRGEKHVARGVLPQVLFNGFFAGLWAMYFLQRTRQVMRIRELRFNFDVLLGMSWRVVVGGAAANTVAKRLFKNRERLDQARIAESEVKKIMMQVPNHKPHLPIHRKPNSYLLI